MRAELAPPVPFLAAYRQGGHAARGPGWLRELRESAMQAYAATGLPAKDPAWSHTDLRSVAETPFRPAPSGAHLEPAAAEAHHFPGEGARLAFVDGRFAPHLSRLPERAAGIRIAPLSQAWTDEAVMEQLDRHADPDAPFTALNLAFLEDGALLEMAPGAELGEPLHVLWLSSGTHPEPTMTHPRLLVLAGERSRAALVETHASLGTAPTLANGVTEIVADPEAVVQHVRVQRESLRASHLHSLHVRQRRHSRVETFLLSMGAGLSRHEAHVHLDAEGAEAQVDGLFLGTGHQSVDCVSRIGHHQPRTTSRQLYKGIMDGSARGAFTGHIVVRPDAQKTSAEQTNRNLLLSRKALVDSVPGLEILADDVKCSHGSTIGRLDEDALFFLQSRGIAAERARLLLTQAFAAEALRRVAHDGVRSHLAGLLTSWFSGRKDVEVEP